MKESKPGRKRKRSFGGPATAASDAKEDDDEENKENMELETINSSENIETNEVTLRVRAGDNGAGNTAGRILIDVSNWQTERSPFGDMLISPNGQILSKEYA